MSELSISKVEVGRTATVRVAPNEDLVSALCEAARKAGFGRALVRRGLGSLVYATLVNSRGEEIVIHGPAVEIASLHGIVAADCTADVSISGLVGDPSGLTYGGRFVPGSNPVLITMEAVLEEILETSAS